MRHLPKQQLQFSSLIIAWQAKNGRHNLPWQNTRDAYLIWLSEIMLQQTQVAAVIGYYTRFIARFPNVQSLANAPLDEVLTLWAGLGYYARARNLHLAAKIIVEKYNGHFPPSPEALEKLPGIGKSTASAIAAFAFGTRAAILDGNVKRVLARVFAFNAPINLALNEQKLWLLANQLLPKKNIEQYIQGQMDLGALCCTRTKPTCTICPLQKICEATKQNRQHELPQKTPKKVKPQRFSNVLLMSNKTHLLLEKRPPNGIWGGLWVLPEILGDEKNIQKNAENHAKELGFRIQKPIEIMQLKHSFTHFHLHIKVWRADVLLIQKAIKEDPFAWIEKAELAQFGMPSPMQKILRFKTISQ